MNIFSSTKTGDTTSFMVVEKSLGSLNTFFRQDVNLELLQRLMSLILQTILTYNYLNNNSIVKYFNHNDLHTGNVLYSTTSDETIEYNLERGSIKINTFGLLAKIWDFGTSNLVLNDGTINGIINGSFNVSHITDNKYTFDIEDKSKCSIDVLTFMNKINENYIKLIKPEIIYSLSSEARQIYNDINHMIEFYESRLPIYLYRLKDYEDTLELEIKTVEQKIIKLDTEISELNETHSAASSAIRLMQAMKDTLEETKSQMKNEVTRKYNEYCALINKEISNFILTDLSEILRRYIISH